MTSRARAAVRLRRIGRAALFTSSIGIVALSSRTSAADEHAGHHPDAAAAPAMGAPATGAPAMQSTSTPAANAPAGGMGAMMGGMMGGAKPGAASGGCKGGDCGAGAGGTPIYPSLMTLPAVTPEKRAEIDALATQQIGEGMARLASGSAALNAATRAGDSAAMQVAIGSMRGGLDEIDAGVAARRVISEGTAPRNLALGWFKREMSLASPPPHAEPHTLFGVTPFHLFTMVLLVAFALAMLAMYFFKMRRAAALFGRLEADSGKPPPGSSPPLAGTPAPATPAPATPAAASAAAPAPAGPPTPPPSTPAPSTPAPQPSPSPPQPSPPASPPPAAPSSPVKANWRGQLRVGSIVAETPTVKTFRLLPVSGDARLPFTFVPGQFLNVAFSIGGTRMNRSYSISSSPTPRGYVELTVRREPRGAVSRHIDDLVDVGDSLEIGGPVGRFTFSGTEADSVVLIAGGVGITPMMSIARYLTEISWSGDVFLLYACRAPADFIFRKELEALQQQNPKLHVVVTMSRAEGTDWTGPRGRLTKELLTQTVPNLASRRIHLCGPPSLMDATKAMLTELGVPAEQVKTEAFGATKPVPAPEGSLVKPTAPATGPLVDFSKNAKSAKIHEGQTVLELSEELGIGIEFSCRVGTCGVCKVKMTSGEVDMAVQDALDPNDKTNGIILACQAKPKTDVVVEA